MSSVIDDSKIKRKCQIFTPQKIVENLLDIAGYNNNLFGKRVLENSCGNGEVLVQIVKKYIDDCINNNFSIRKIKAGLENDLFAFDIDKKLIEDCRNRLNVLTLEYGINSVNWKIYCQDFLKLNLGEQFDFIIGNPPYVAYQDLPKDVRNFVRKTYSTCQKGKFDYSYAFIEKSYSVLKSGGKLVYIIPSNIFKNIFAHSLRTLIKKDLCTIIDYPSDFVFKDVLVAPAIIKVVKNSNAEDFIYKSNNNNFQEIRIRKDSLNDKWVFENEVEELNFRVGDYFKVSCSIATLLNKAFIIKNAKKEGNYYVIEGFKFEKDALKKAASPKHIKKNKCSELIIFPYHYSDTGKLLRYSEEEMYRLFPCTMQYLELFRKELEERTAEKNVSWFEFGRSQALNNIIVKKLIVSTVISNCTKAYILEEEEIPYSGMYIVSKGNKSLSSLIKVLNTNEFKKYVNQVGVSVKGMSKRIGPKDIENYTYKEE